MSVIERLELELENINDALKERKPPRGLEKNQTLINERWPLGDVTTIKTKEGNSVRRTKVDYTDDRVKKHIVEMYYIKRKEILENNKKVMEGAIGKLKNDSFESLVDTIDRRYRGIPRPEIEKAIREHYRRKNSGWIEYADNSEFRDSERKHTTSFGLRVRSKSEVLIAEKLWENNVQFWYEPKVYFGGKPVAPDFLINCPGGKQIIWEHLGLTNDSEYLKRNEQKIRIYMENGFVPWDNLIITYDGLNGQIDLARVMFEIENMAKGN